MLKKLYLITIVAAVIFASPIFADEKKQAPRPRPVAKASKHKETLASMSDDKLEESFKLSKAQLRSCLAVNPDSSDLYESIAKLSKVAVIAAERVKRASDWDINVIKDNPAKYFKQSANVIKEYLAFTADQGPLHKAVDKVISSAGERAKAFSDKAGEQEMPKYRDKYKQLADIMNDKQKKLSGIWAKIVESRGAVEKSLVLLDESQGFYNDVKTTFGERAAMRELNDLCGQLDELTKSMKVLQKSITGEKAAPKKKCCEKGAPCDKCKSKLNIGALAKGQTCPVNADGKKCCEKGAPCDKCKKKASCPNNTTEKPCEKKAQEAEKDCKK